MIVLSLALALAAAEVRIEVRPERPYVEDAGWARHLSFDFVLENTGERALRLDEIQASVLDGSGALASGRSWAPAARAPASARCRLAICPPGARSWCSTRSTPGSRRCRSSAWFKS